MGLKTNIYSCVIGNDLAGFWHNFVQTGLKLVLILSRKISEKMKPTSIETFVRCAFLTLRYAAMLYQKTHFQPHFKQKNGSLSLILKILLFRVETNVISSIHICRHCVIWNDIWAPFNLPKKTNKTQEKTEK